MSLMNDDVVTIKVKGILHGFTIDEAREIKVALDEIFPQEPILIREYYPVLMDAKHPSLGASFVPMPIATEVTGGD